MLFMMILTIIVPVPIIFSKLSVRMLLKDADDTLNKSKEEEKKAAALEEEKKAAALEEEKRKANLKKPQSFDLKINDLSSEYSEVTSENMKIYKLRIVA